MTHEQPVLNQMIEDYLAHGATEADHAMMLTVWCRLGAEYMARAAGRQYTLDALENTREFIRRAQPVNEWRP